MGKDLRNVGIELAIKKPSLYFTATFSGVLTLLTVLFQLSIFDIKEGLDNIVLPLMIIFFLIVYSILIESLFLLKEEDKLTKEIPLLIIGYSNLVTLIVSGKIEWVIDTDEVIIRPPTWDESTQFFDDNTSIISCYLDNKKIIDYAAIGIQEYEGFRLVRDKAREDEDIIKAISNIDLVNSEIKENNDNEESIN